MSLVDKRLVAPTWGRVAAALLVMCAFALPAAGQPRKKGAPPPPAPPAGDRAAPESKTGPAAVGGDPSTPGTPEPKDDKKKGGKEKGPKTFDFTALDLNGRMRSPQLLYFLERANEELERASLEKRSFIPHIVRSMEEEQL